MYVEFQAISLFGVFFAVEGLRKKKTFCSRKIGEYQIQEMSLNNLESV